MNKKVIAKICAVSIILLGVGYVLVELGSEAKRISNNNAKIEERNKEMRELKNSSWSPFEKEYGIKLPSLKDCENVNSGSSPTFKEACKEVWKYNP